MEIMNNPRFILATGAVLMALAVGFGAFGAHIVQGMLTPERFAVYQTGVQYHFYHALGLLLVGLISLHIRDSKWLEWSGWCLLAGIIIFSGSLYILTLTDTPWLGAVTPVGGVAFILGWVLLVAGVLKQ
jgi:uncharacterized membrane protein YgdD (TMEM256/DUF423 family)